jgi:hypothetical protein
MKYAHLRGNGLQGNIIFDRSNPANRDDCFEPYSLLKKRFYEAGIQLDTSDITSSKITDFELHQDVQVKSCAKTNYLLMLETKFVLGENGNSKEWAKYRKIFTWDDNLVDSEKFIKINYPNPFRVHADDGYFDRPRLCCMISGNKTLSVVDARDLYIERVKSIRWFEQNAPQDFDLYGTDWDIPAWGRGFLGKVSRRVLRKIIPLNKLHPFPSYRGRVDHKFEVLSRVRFAICYENIRDVPGYITEKIFDCFFSGCVPVYWGADNISEYIPAECFIDRRKFADTGDVYEYIKGMSEQEFKGYQQSIAAFLISDASIPFSSEYFVETVVSTIEKDLGE